MKWATQGKKITSSTFNAGDLLDVTFLATRTLVHLVWQKLWELDICRVASPINPWFSKISRQACSPLIHRFFGFTSEWYQGKQIYIYISETAISCLKISLLKLKPIPYNKILRGNVQTYKERHDTFIAWILYLVIVVHINPANANSCVLTLFGQIFACPCVYYTITLWSSWIDLNPVISYCGNIPWSLVSEVATKPGQTMIGLDSDTNNPQNSHSAAWCLNLPVAPFFRLYSSRSQGACYLIDQSVGLLWRSEKMHCTP